MNTAATSCWVSQSGLSNLLLELLREKLGSQLVQRLFFFFLFSKNKTINDLPQAPAWL